MQRKEKTSNVLPGSSVCECLDYSLYIELWNDAHEAGYAENDPEMTQQEWDALDYDARQWELDDLREGIRTEGQQGLSSRRLVQPPSEFIEAGDEDDYDRGGSNYACPQCDSYCEPDETCESCGHCA
jgi:hypothetical protein